ncbi:MAG: hypothetical protein ABW161_10200 [Candidatus Thiodiazotropha sp.]
MKIDKRDQLTRNAMADVRANRVVDHQAVQDWADRLDSNKPLPAPTAKKAAQEAASSRSNI